MQRLIPWITVVLCAACAASAEPPTRAADDASLALVKAQETTAAEPAGSLSDAATEPAQAQALPSEAVAAEPAVEPLSLSEPLPAVGVPLGDVDGQGEVAGEAELELPVPGDPLPDPSPTVVRFVPFGANPGTSEADFADMSAMLAEKYHGQPGPEREAALDAALAGYHVVDRTPAWINQINGLDMTDPADVVVARTITRDWYIAQERYKKVAINGDQSDLSEVAVNGRVIVLRAWVRFWKGELERGTIERYRGRLDDLVREMERLRAQRRAGADLGGG